MFAGGAALERFLEACGSAILLRNDVDSTFGFAAGEGVAAAS